ncbi:DNA repair protein RadC [Lacticaseibacillus jixianensis]|uniref:DNA repair protein RadC n=1 Tax=Lacticaseibacillus jixianensis TaxID=2486012 RepID=A0ABW4B9J9_9LACO|nr:DNA repair protein RadC [Lacticaseibacillus jixianensis]
MRPRELIQAHGAGALSDKELLEAVIGSGGGHWPVAAVAEQVLQAYPTLSGLNMASAGELTAVPGLGPSKAARLVASLELARRVQQRQTLRFGEVLDAQQIGEAMVQRLAGAPEEHLLALMLDVRNAIIREVELAHGGVDKSIADPRVVFRLALSLNASRLILVHNHPSGDHLPSEMDSELTARLSAAGNLIGVLVIDHIIVGGGQFYSFRQAGHL